MKVANGSRISVRSISGRKMIFKHVLFNAMLTRSLEGSPQGVRAIRDGRRGVGETGKGGRRSIIFWRSIILIGHWGGLHSLQAISFFIPKGS